MSTAAREAIGKTKAMPGTQESRSASYKKDGAASVQVPPRNTPCRNWHQTRYCGLLSRQRASGISLGSISMSRIASTFAFLLVAVGLAGCTTNSPEALAAHDPFEPTNRSVFNFTQKVDKYVLKP